MAIPELVNLLREAITASQISETKPIYIYFKCADKKKDNFLQYESCASTRRAHREIDEHCRFMQKQLLTHEGEPLDAYHVIRNLRDWGKDGCLLCGGRAWPNYGGDQCNPKAEKTYRPMSNEGQSHGSTPWVNTISG